MNLFVQSPALEQNPRLGQYNETADLPTSVPFCKNLYRFPKSCLAFQQEYRLKCCPILASLGSVASPEDCFGKP